MSQPGWVGSFRVGGLYLAGVIFGSLAASIVQPSNYLVGASAGVYALIAAHLGQHSLEAWSQSSDASVVPSRLECFFKVVEIFLVSKRTRLLVFCKFLHRCNLR
jgi:membrane associated rhomboid family serine protease